MKSMTGFGRAHVETENRRVEVEIRSWNNKGFEAQIKLPAAYAHLESGLRETLSTTAQRGKVFALVTLYGKGLARDIRINEDLIAGVLEPVQKLAARLGLACNISVQDLLAVPGGLEVIEAPDGMVETDIRKTFADAIELWDATRRTEGERCKASMVEEIAALKKAAAFLDQRRPAALAEHQTRLKTRIAEIIAATGGAHDEKRLEMEIALLAEKSDVSEELVRLRAHIDRAEKLMASATKPAGAELLFVAQEMLRETNTVGSKTQDLLSIQSVIDAKRSIDRIREMAANVV